MIITAIGDTHGSTKWEKIIEKELKTSDKIIFVGDYFDAYGKDITEEDEYKNFENILKLKKEYGEKIILLLGNHELHYLDGINKKYARFREKNYKKVNKILNLAINNNLVQIAAQFDDVLYTHAGVTKTWLTNSNITNSNNIANSINDLFLKDKKYFDFQGLEGITSEKTGDNIFQGPLWVRGTSLLSDKLDVKQVVGHTKYSIAMTFEDLAFIDLLGRTTRYLNIENGNFINKK